MRLVGAIGVTVAAAAGYFAARQLLEREDLVERLPQPVRPPLAAVRARLLFARERAAAEAELLADYYRRVDRPQPGELGARRRPDVWRPNDPFGDRA